jgi:hypothetical protein
VRRERIKAEVYLLRKRFTKVEFDPDGYWVCIYDFDLPRGCNKAQSCLLIELDSSYPFTPPKNCYIDRNIRSSSGEPIDHYFPGSRENKFFAKGWAWLSLHLDGWKPTANIVQGDNLLKFCDLVYLALEDLVRGKGGR